MLDNSLFSGLKSVGLGGLSNMDIYEAEEEKPQQQVEERKKITVTEDEYLFDKVYECPVCANKIKNKTVRANKAKLISTDMDLRPKYQVVDPVKYDCVVCDKCGYAALTRYFGALSSMQIKLIKENVSANFKGLPETGDFYTYEDALVRYQLALANSVIKKSRASEKAYNCLKLAWIFRGMAENMPADEKNVERKKVAYNEEEKKYLSKAYEGFVTAMQKEDMPICGMDRGTLTFLLAALAVETEAYTDASRYISEIITSKAMPTRIKDKARELKEKMKK